MTYKRILLATTGPRSVALIRAAVGAVFMTEGWLKFIDPALGVERFTRIGLPMPEVFAPAIGGIELVCGALVLAGLVTRAAAVLLAAVMVGAIVSTKLPLLSTKGLAFTAHEARLDYTMFLAAISLVTMGAGSLSADNWLLRRLDRRRPEPLTREPLTHEPGAHPVPHRHLVSSRSENEPW